MNMTAAELVTEYGGKLKACESLMVRSLEKLSSHPDASKHQKLAQDSVKILNRLRARYNLVLQAHGTSVDPLLKGLAGPEDAVFDVQLNQEQAWVLDHIDDMYSRLAG